MLENAVTKLDDHWADLVKMYGETSVLYKGIVIRNQLAKSLQHLAPFEKPSVKELLKDGLATLFPGEQ